jgi:hypothetical protein
VTRTWSVRGTIKEKDGKTTPIRGVTINHPSYFCVGKIETKSGIHVKIDGVSFCFKIESRKNISCLPIPGLRSGYYIANVGSGNAELEDAYRKKIALGNNKYHFLSKPGALTPITIKIKESNREFEFKIQ